MGRRFPAGLQVLHDTVDHGQDLLLHLEELADRVALQPLSADLSHQRVQLAQEIGLGQLRRAQDEWFEQICEGRKGAGGVKLGMFWLCLYKVTSTEYGFRARGGLLAGAPRRARRSLLGDFHSI